MIVDALKEHLAREPFQPFRVRASSRKSYVVRNPSMVVLLKTWVFIAAPDSDRFATVPYLHVASIETIANGNGKHRARRKPRG